ncbi:MAG: hypothetical protein E5Y63_01900 [Mesorhizobium sp.]|uniref:hypothetical protein n=1 Tax=Mesorhizobium sp. TaxID=1871066 RepID=UPI0012027063|nr:hypothetical protein [Mesorhizobium sp.]TIM32613.1 MAG: hypothetical protein E5Y63_01900 [Mesorhizobium sp.]
MALITLYRTDDGVDRLLRQPGEVKVDAAARVINLSEADPQYSSLFGAYRADLKTACAIAELWWEDTIAAQQKLGMSLEDAIEESFDKRLAGAASHPKVVWIVRSYWLACEANSAKLLDGDRISPEVLLLKWLVDTGETELVRLIACMPYWPIGLDENGNWC